MSIGTRRSFIAACAATLLFPGCESKLNTHLPIPSPDMQKPPLSDEEFLLLQDSEARKKAVGHGPLIIKDRLIGGGGDTRRLDDVSLENLQFIDCMFIGHMMFGVDMKNVSFERCAFSAVRWEDGKWTDLKFVNCGFFERDVKMLPGGGNGTTLLERCYFRGTEPKNPAYMDYLDFYGTFGMGGKSRYVECEVQRFNLYVDTYMEFENCKFDRLSLSHRFESGALGLTMNGCTVTGEVSMPNCLIEELTLKSSTFDGKVDASLLQAQKVSLEKVVGCFEFVSSRIHHMSATGCTFLQSKNLGDVEEVFGLGVGWTEITHLVLDQCKFDGPHSRLLAHGAEPARDKDGKEVPYVDPKTGKVVNPYTEIETVTLRKTPLVRGNFTYSHIKQLTVEDAPVADLKFPHSKVGRLVLKNVELTGTLDFTGTQVKEVVTENVSRSKLSIVKDKASEINL